MPLLYFEDIKTDISVLLSPILLTQEMRNRHIDLYGEDWPDELSEYPREIGIVPAPMAISAIAGKMGEANWLRVNFMKQFFAKFHTPLYVGDTITAINTVKRKMAHIDSTKDFGYVFVQQDVFNQKKVLAFERRLCYTVYCRPFPYQP